MDGNDCDSRKLIGGATVYSHIGKTYKHNIDCRITFKADKEGWKLLIRLVHLDIPDTSYNQLCNDALYVYDAKNIFGQPVVSVRFYCFAVLMTLTLVHMLNKFTIFLFSFSLDPHCSSNIFFSVLNKFINNINYKNSS